MNTAPIRGRFIDKIPHSVSFRAWRVIESGLALPIETDAATLPDAISQALTGAAFNKGETLLVHEDDTGRRKSTLRIYLIQRKTTPEYRTNSAGKRQAFHRLYERFIAAIAMDAFEPTRPFDAMKDPATGFDYTLLEART